MYAAVGLPWIPPEIRENAGEFEAAAAGTLPHLLELWRSAGRPASPAGVTARPAFARWPKAARAWLPLWQLPTTAPIWASQQAGWRAAQAQAKEVAALNAEFAANGGGFRILRGVEVDITADGAALPDDVLAELDLVVASPHVKLSQSIEQATERLLRAIRNRMSILLDTRPVG